MKFEVAERKKLEQVNNLLEETVCNDDIDVTVESLAIIPVHHLVS